MRTTTNIYLFNLAVADLATRISLGRTARAGQFPWLAALVYRNGRGGAAVLCGGALVIIINIKLHIA